jgi:RsiW-degrading membrane proteinase PrsW (M82 family)
MILLIASVFPVVIFLHVIYQKDHEKEPISLLLKSLFGGCLSVLLSFLMSGPLSTLSAFFPGALMSSFHKSFLLAAIPEEIAKFAVLYFLIWKSSAFNHHYDGIVYAVFVSLGFALVENVLYVFQGGMSVAIGRAVLAVPGHGLFGVLMGYYFSLARFHENPKRRQYLLKGLFIAILFHGGYDFLLMYMSSSADNALLLVFLLIGFAWLVIKLWKKGISKIKKHIELDLKNNSEELGQ